MNSHPVYQDPVTEHLPLISPFAEIYRLGSADLEAIDELMEPLVGRDFQTVSLEEFRHAKLDPMMANIRENLRGGNGIVLLRNLPVTRYDIEDLKTIFWGLGAHIGQAHSQSAAGDVLGCVVDATDKSGLQSGRGYLSRRELSPHTDLTEIVGLMCVRPAAKGGESLLARVEDILAKVKDERPEFMPVYERGFRYHRRGEQADGEADITPYSVPMISTRDGVTSCFYVRDFIDVMLRDTGQQLSQLERDALDFFEEVSQRVDVRIEFKLKAGDALLINNYAVLHARRVFEDDGPPEQRRLLFRLWLETSPPRPLVEDIFVYKNKKSRHGIDPQPGKAPATAAYNTYNESSAPVPSRTNTAA